MPDDLKPCPFCGGSNVGPDWTQEAVMCFECLSAGPEHADKNNAKGAWNTRADAEVLKAADALADAASRLMEQCEDGDGFTEGTAIALDCGIAAYRKARGGSQ